MMADLNLCFQLITIVVDLHYTLLSFSMIVEICKECKIDQSNCQREYSTFRQLFNQFMQVIPSD